LARLLEGAMRGRNICMTFAPMDRPATPEDRLFRHWLDRSYLFLPVGIVLRLHPRHRPVDVTALLQQNERIWSSIALPEFRGVRTDEDLDSDYVANHYACMLVNFAGLYERTGNLPTAEELYLRAAALSPHYRPAAAALVAVRRRLEGQRS